MSKQKPELALSTPSDAEISANQASSQKPLSPLSKELLASAPKSWTYQSTLSEENKSDLNGLERNLKTAIEAAMKLIPLRIAQNLPVDLQKDFTSDSLYEKLKTFKSCNSIFAFSYGCSEKNARQLEDYNLPHEAICFRILSEGIHGENADSHVEQMLLRELPDEEKPSANPSNSSAERSFSAASCCVIN